MIAPDSSPVSALDSAPAGYRPCAGIALFNGAGQVLLARRTGFMVEYGWQMPQGGIDADEDPLAAAYRELTEETSVPAAQVTLLGAIDAWLTYDFDTQAIARGKMARKFKGQAQRWFAFRLNGPDSLINLETEQPEFDVWEWSSLAVARERIVPFKRGVYARVADEFAKFER